MKKITRRLQLNDNNSTMQKFMKMCDIAEELGINISFHQHAIIVTDKDRENSLPDLYLEDMVSNHNMNEFPPLTEYRLVYDNPEYLAQKSLEYNKRRMSESVEIAEKAAKEKVKLTEEAAKRVANLEASERYVLAQLKAKYPDAT